MALGNKRSESSAEPTGPTSAPPPPPAPPGPPFASPLAPDGLISSLDERLAQLQATVAALVERTAGSASAAPVADPEVLAASRTLKMAEQTAEATVSEARDEATKLVGDAREKHDAMLQAARDAADVEFAAQREAVMAEAAAWETRKQELLVVLADLDAKLTECDARLAEAHRMVRDALDHPVIAPTASMSSPTPAVQPETLAPAADAEPFAAPAPAPVAADPAEPFAAPAPVAADPVESPSGGTVFGNPPAPVFTGPSRESTETAAFYPWSGDSSVKSDSEVIDAPDEVPAPPVQRRGLFGH